MDWRVNRALAIAIAAIVLALVALWQRSPVVLADQRPSPQVQSVSVGAVGRYQLVINPEMRADTFLLDTATGRVWVKAKFVDLESEPVAWEFMDRLDSLQEALAWLNPDFRFDGWTD